MHESDATVTSLPRVPLNLDSRPALCSSHRQQPFLDSAQAQGWSLPLLPERVGMPSNLTNKCETAQGGEMDWLETPRDGAVACQHSLPFRA